MSRATKALQRNILARQEEIKKSQPLPKKPPVRKVPAGTKIDRQCEKTPLMLILEAQFEKPIEELVWQGSIYEVMEVLEVSNFTVSSWRKRFPIEYQRGKNNRKLPVAKSGNNNGAGTVS